MAIHDADDTALGHDDVLMQQQQQVESGYRVCGQEAGRGVWQRCDD